MPSRSGRRGFTLVELLVVVGVIAALLAILLPTVSQASRSARTVQCLSALHQLALVDQMYQTESGGYHLPAFWGWSPSSPGWDPNTPPAIAASGPYQSWANVPLVYRTLGTGKVSGRFYRQMICPDASLATADSNATPDGYGIGLSYGVNQTQLPGYAAAGAPNYFNAWRTSQVRSPAEKIQFVDAIGSVSIGGTPNPTIRYFLPTWGEVHYAPDHSSIVAYRHRGGGCALCFDGHAAWSVAASLMYDPTNPRTLVNRRQWQPTTP
jgi:prepilin-type N-terminal cleavage/methylation domain-containing protein